MAVYGPYLDKRKNRRFVDVDGKRTNYARYLLEQHLGRKLEFWEEAHHINNNKLDDRIENLEVKHQSLHKMEHRETLARGSKVASAKLTDIQVLEIRAMYATKQYYIKDIMKKYNIGKTSVFNIINGVTWSHI